MDERSTRLAISCHSILSHRFSIRIGLFQRNDGSYHAGYQCHPQHFTVSIELSRYSFIPLIFQVGQYFSMCRDINRLCLLERWYVYSRVNIRFNSLGLKVNSWENPKTLVRLINIPTPSRYFKLKFSVPVGALRYTGRF